MNTMTRSKRGGCGCGGKGGTGCGCGCAGAVSPGETTKGEVCDPCQEAGFVRPRFFAGQLLTEDDFEALLAYIIGKDRFRNARLFGAGVVCGFEIACDPCGGGKVIVRPGYALDCCGNDLVLSCERRLDLNRMIAALREARHGGHGCPDPCLDAGKPEPCDQDPAKEGARPAKARPTARYCIYVRYAEQQTEPVARYATGDDCDGATCEATRIAEGVTFELRCPPERASAKDMFEQLVEAVECLGQAKQPTTDLVILQHVAGSLEQALVADAAPAPVPVKTWTAEVEYLLAEPHAHGRLFELGQHLAAASRFGGDAEISSKRGVEAEPLVPRMARLLESSLERDDKQPVFRSELERAYVQEAIRLYKRAGKPEATTFEDELFARGAVFGPKLAAASIQSMKVLAQAVHEAERCGVPSLSDCGLSRDAARRAAASDTPVPEPEPKAVAYFVASILEVVELVVRFLVARMCHAVNPPCRPCDDEAVLLACVEVDGCEVVHICNLSRDYVWSPTALQHWLPPARWLGRVIEEACCNPAALAHVPEHREPIVEAEEPSYGLTVAGAAKFATVTRFYRDHMHPKVMTMVFDSVGHVMRRQLERSRIALPFGVQVSPRHQLAHLERELEMRQPRSEGPKKGKS